MDKIRITQSGWEGFTGQLGYVEFKDGTSVSPVPQVFADRISALIECQVVAADGEQSLQAGIAARLVGGETIPAEVEEALERQTDQDRTREEALIKITTSKEAEQELYTKEQLEALVDKEGLAGLRKVGDIWQVRDRSIPKLIEKILVAQDAFVTARKQALDEAAQVHEADRIVAEALAAGATPVPQTDVPVSEPEESGEQDGAGDDLSGDLSGTHGITFVENDEADEDDASQEEPANDPANEQLDLLDDANEGEGEGDGGQSDDAADKDEANEGEGA